MKIYLLLLSQAPRQCNQSFDLFPQALKERIEMKILLHTAQHIIVSQYSKVIPQTS